MYSIFQFSLANMNVHNLLCPAGLWICITKCRTYVQRPWHADTANKAGIGSFHSNDSKYLHINNHHNTQNLHLKMNWNLLFHSSILPCAMVCTESHRTAGLSMTLPLCRSASNTKTNYCFLEGSGTWLMRQWWLSYVHTTWSMWVQTNMQELIPQIFSANSSELATYGFLISQQHSSFPLQDESPGLATTIWSLQLFWQPQMVNQYLAEWSLWTDQCYLLLLGLLQWCYRRGWTNTEHSDECLLHTSVPFWSAESGRNTTKGNSPQAGGLVW